jgi:hypothetical protein
MSIGPPGDLTGLRLVLGLSGGHDFYAAYPNRTDSTGFAAAPGGYNGLGSPGDIGLVLLTGAGYTASLQCVHIWTLC